MSPAPNPSRMFATKISQMLDALYIMNQAITSGMFTIIIALFRPNESVINAEQMLPIGSETYPMLPVNFEPKGK